MVVMMIRVKKMTKMSEDVATGILSGVIKVSETITGTVVNSKVGKKFFNILPGEIILASFDGFSMFNSLFLCCSVSLSVISVLIYRNTSRSKTNYLHIEPLISHESGT